ncbi:MAG: MBL fold metallo-hydrolase [Thermovirgaceae bacterium]
MGAEKTSLIFLGTGGSRFTIMHQLRASGGLWFNWKGFPVAIDPGPGSLVRMRQHNPPLDPETLEAILVTHKHLDHTTDLNVLTETMTSGGSKKRGTVLLPSDTLGESEPVLYKYLQEKVRRLGTWKKESRNKLGGSRSVRAVPLIHHGVECYGLVFTEEGIPLWGLVSDTRYDREWVESFSGCKLLVVNMTLARGRDNLDHLAPEHVAAVVERLTPELTILTHFGRGVLKQGPELIAENIGKGRSRVVAAQDGMLVDIETLEIRLPSHANF